MKNLNFRALFELACRLYVFFFLNFYGSGKIMGGQFYRKGALPEEVFNTPLGEASAFELAWTFMGYSFYYILFIGASQIMGAWLLLWNRTKIPGVIILFPIMVNIVVFDIIFLDQPGALANATIYLLMLFYILYHNGNRIADAIRTFTSPYPKSSMGFKNPAFKYATLVIILALIFVIDQSIVNFLGH